TVDDGYKQLAEEVSEPWIQEAITHQNQCQKEIKCKNKPKVYIEITLITINNRYKQTQEEPAADDEADMQLRPKISRLQKEVEKIKQRPFESQEKTPFLKRRRRHTRSTKNSYKIPYEKIRHVLQEAEKGALKEVQGQWASFLNKLKSMNAPAHAT